MANASLTLRTFTHVHVRSRCNRTRTRWFYDCTHNDCSLARFVRGVAWFLLQLHPVSRGISIVSIYLTIACNCSDMHPRTSTRAHVWPHFRRPRLHTSSKRLHVCVAGMPETATWGREFLEEKYFFLWGREDQLLTLLYRPTHRKTIAAETVLVRFCG